MVANFQSITEYTMNNRTYQTELTSLRDVLSKLDKEDVDLTTAMQLYNEGVQYKKTCMDTLDSLEDEVKRSSQTTVVAGDGSQKLDTIFGNLEDIENSMDALSDTEIEATVELLIQAEKLFQAGEAHVQALAEEIKKSQQTTRANDV